jgi:nicotinamide riboside kinase
MRKLVVTGAHSTGKTSLARAIIEDLSARGLTATLVGDVARDCPFPIGLSQTEQGTLWLLHQQAAAELRAESAEVDWIVCDRGIPDILAHGAYIRLRGAPDSRLMDSLKPYMTEWMDTYTFVLHSLIDERVPLAADGLREPDPAYRMRIEQLIKDELRGVGSSLCPLPPDLAGRRKLVQARIWSVP